MNLTKTQEILAQDADLVRDHGADAEATLVRALSTPGERMHTIRDGLVLSRTQTLHEAVADLEAVAQTGATPQVRDAATQRAAHLRELLTITAPSAMVAGVPAPPGAEPDEVHHLYGHPSIARDGSRMLRIVGRARATPNNKRRWTLTVFTAAVLALIVALVARANFPVSQIQDQWHVVLSGTPSDATSVSVMSATLRLVLLAFAPVLLIAGGHALLARTCAAWLTPAFREVQAVKLAEPHVVWLGMMTRWHRGELGSVQSAWQYLGASTPKSGILRRAPKEEPSHDVVFDRLSVLVRRGDEAALMWCMEAAPILAAFHEVGKAPSKRAFLDAQERAVLDRLAQELLTVVRDKEAEQRDAAAKLAALSNASEEHQRDERARLVREYAARRGLKLTQRGGDDA